MSALIDNVLKNYYCRCIARYLIRNPTHWDGGLRVGSSRKNRFLNVYRKVLDHSKIHTSVIHYRMIRKYPMYRSGNTGLRKYCSIGILYCQVYNFSLVFPCVFEKSITMNVIYDKLRLRKTKRKTQESKRISKSVRYCSVLPVVGLYSPITITQGPELTILYVNAA